MKLQVKGTQTQHVEVTVDALDAAQLAADTLLHMYGLGGWNGHWIDSDGNLCDEIDYGHGTPGTKILGKASDDQKRVYQVAREFMTLFRGGQE